MRIYNLIPADIKPSHGATKLHYADAFDNDFALLLRKINSTTIPAMFIDTLEVDANMMACGKIKPKAKVDKRKGREETYPIASTSSSSDVKFEMMLKTMENLRDQLTVEAKPAN